MAKINCPYHEDNTASMEVYPDGWAHCFGCGKHVTLDTLDIPGLFEGNFNFEAAPKYREDLNERLAYIDTLPVAQVRGLYLPVDSSSYYIVWPDRSYYNQRFFDVTDNKGKYKCPAGHPKKPFWARRAKVNQMQQHGDWPLLIVEGEINALSLHQAITHPFLPDIVSPGGAGDFYSKNHQKYLPDYLEYRRIKILADADAAGAQACIELKALLTGAGHKNVQIQLMETDANDILVKEGPKALREKVGL